MRYATCAAFERSLRGLEEKRKARVQETITRFVKAIDIGQRTPGLGLKQLRHGVWEIRAGLLDRILFLREGDLLQFLIVGTHDDIRRFLKSL
ncbi:MAG: hypothetical protein HYZ73_03390 [Elusimicrobia bacterium]|nr:hypothetical protein [Elusimicrobiota bacterium]